MRLPTSQPRSPLGSRAPRVEVRPASVGTHGDIAAELAAAAGLRLEPWQVDGLRIMLSYRADGRWAAFEHAELVPRQNGKTATLQARALAGLLLLGEELILWSAHEYKTAMRAFLDLRGRLLELGDEVRPNVIDIDGVLVKVNNTNGDESFQRLDTGATVKIVARSKGSGRGFSADCIVIDEAFAYTELHAAALMPTLTARPNPQLLYASSPPLDRWTGGPLFGLRARALSGEDDALGWRDWGLAIDLDELSRLTPAKRKELLDDRARWAATNPALGRGRVSEESVLRNRRSLDDENFARECMGCWPVPAAEGGQIPRAAWVACRDPESVPRRAEVVAVEATMDRSSALLLVAGHRDDGLPHIEVIDVRPGMSWVVEACIGLRDRHGCSFVVDPAGPAGPLAPDLIAEGLDVVQPKSREWVAACAGFWDALLEGRLRHRGQTQLDDAAAVALRRDVGDGAWAWARRASGGDIAALTAGTAGLWALDQVSTYDVLESVW